MTTTALTVHLSSLDRKKLVALREQAKTLGMSAEGYARQLIEDGISLEQRARTMTFDELYAPVQARFRRTGMTEADLDELVGRARSRHHRPTPRKKS